MSAQVAADLRAAAEVLERDGWRQDDIGSCDGPKCMVGAINFAVTAGASVDDFDDDDTDEEWRANVATQAVAGHLGTDCIHITNWNDATGRTAAEVIAALRAAADRAEADQ